MSPYYRALREVFGTGLLLVPGVAGIVHDAQGRLLLQRKHDGSWSLPAGAIEPGESPQQAMARELLEETGIEAQAIHLVACHGGAAFRHVHPANGHAVEYVILLFHCVGRIRGDAVLNPETAELRYFSRDTFPGLQLPYPVDLLYRPLQIP